MCSQKSNAVNTAKIGDDFENICYELIISAIKDEKFAFPLKFASVKKKAKYYSSVRDKEIVFDLAIEIWPPDATNYSNLYLIECKSYSTRKVEISDLTNFSYNVNDVAELNGKAVFITNSSYTTTDLTFAKKTGMMLIEVDQDDSLSILLYKKNRRKELNTENHLKEFESFIKNVFHPVKVEGLKKLSSKNIEKITTSILSDLDASIIQNYNKYTLESLTEYMKNKYSISFEYSQLLKRAPHDEVLGSFNRQENRIEVDKSLSDSSRLGFVMAHEYGHAILHNEIKINNEHYNQFHDSEYDFTSDKHRLTNYKHWIEWQANKFATTLLMPSMNLRFHLGVFQKSIGISRYGHIYLDEQPINRSDFKRIMIYLTNQFNTTSTSIGYRLEELGLITYA